MTEEIAVKTVVATKETQITHIGRLVLGKDGKCYFHISSEKREVNHLDYRLGM